MIHFLRFFYNWYDGAVWSNVFVIVIIAPLGYLWSKSKWWPLNGLHTTISKLHLRFLRHQDDMARHVRRQHEHNQWQHKHLVEMYEKHMDKPAEKHPYF